MTYAPIPETTVNTPFGNLRLVVNGENFAQILATAPDEGKITVNGVTYAGRIEFEKQYLYGWRIKRRSSGNHEYIDGISLKRADNWSKSLSDSARNKVAEYFDGEFCRILATSPTITNLGRDANLRNAEAAHDRAQSEVVELEAKLATARRAAVEAECRLNTARRLHERI